jgi:mannitol-1-/sugar-/sorbitol-6-phosphatase
MENDVTLACKAVLFDMDGTLVDSTRAVELAWSRWASKYNLPLETVLSFSHGRPTISTLEHFFPGRDHTADIREMEGREETQIEDISPIPGALHVIQALENRPWAIVTSAWRKLAEARVLAAGLALPKIIVPVDEIENGKPHPEGFLKAAQQLGVAPQDCLVFEDTRPGIDAGLNAGMQVVGLLTTFSVNQLRYRPSVRDFRDVTVQLQGEVIRVKLTAGV